MHDEPCTGDQFRMWRLIRGGLSVTKQNTNASIHYPGSWEPTERLIASIFFTKIGTSVHVCYFCNRMKLALLNLIHHLFLILSSGELDGDDFLAEWRTETIIPRGLPCILMASTTSTGKLEHARSSKDMHRPCIIRFWWILAKSYSGDGSLWIPP